MNNKEILINMINNEILIDIEDAIDELFEIIAKKEYTHEDEIDLKEFRELKDEFTELLKELNNNEIEEDEILEYIEEFKQLNDESVED